MDKAKQQFYDYRPIEEGTISNRTKASKVVLEILNDEIQSNKISRKVLKLLNQCTETINALKLIKNHNHIYRALILISKNDFIHRINSNNLFPDNLKSHLNCVINGEFKNALKQLTK